MKCANCGKGIMIGHNVSHAKNRTRKIFKPNLHFFRIKVGPNYKKMRLCTKCSRLFKKREQPKVEISSAAPAAAGLA